MGRRGATFLDEARAAAIAWKSTSPDLPDEARGDGRYSGKGSLLAICLPVASAPHTLVPEARNWAIDYFARAGIPWHHGMGVNPGNHLLSSQVQCVNALAPMAHRPDALRSTFGDVLDIAEVLPFGDPIDETSHVAFEWIGLEDHLNEHPGKAGSRGANNTSADAAIRYRTPSGQIEIALIEWKFTERYTGQPLSGGAKSKAVRMARYAELFVEPEGPIRVDLLPLDDLFVEPVYQLLRLQLLAWQMERTGELGADRVRVVYAASSRNEALWRSITESQAQIGRELYTYWPRMLRRPDRFVLFDTARLVGSGAETGADFKARYAPLGPASTWPTQRRADLEQAASTAVAHAEAVFLRLAGEGSVLEQALAPGALESASDGQLMELAARAEEAAELARRLRADSLSGVLHPGSR